MDIALSLVGLVLLTPVFLAIAIWIKLDSPGPVFFRQERVGKGEKPFRIWKFRTMRNGGLDQRQITVGDDRRVTPSGRTLRRYKLDELPQLFNVLTGEMSLVGPRPEVPRYVAEYPPAARAEIFSVRPGMTDLASIRYIDEAEVLGRALDPEHAYLQQVLPQKLDESVRYVRTRSLPADIGIILRTLGRILGRRTAG